MRTPKFLEKIRKEEADFLKAPIYLYGTEAIGAYYLALELEGKSVLTINGSGDQVLNAYYFGAKRVVGFDIVKSTKYMLDLKIAAIKNLNYKEFLNFFGDKKEIGNFNFNFNSSFRSNLENDTVRFFDELFEKYERNGQALLESDNFRKRKEFCEKLDEINPFLANEKNYKVMQERMSEVNLEFVEADICDIYKKVDGTFDLINLSNVLNYISKDLTGKGVDNPLESMYEYSIFNLREKLSENGKIIFYCFYRSPEEMDTMPLINKDSSLEWIASQEDFEVSKIKFKGILKGMDSVNVLEIKNEIN